MPFPFAVPKGNTQNPLLLPNFDQPFSVNGVLSLVNPSDLAPDLVANATPASGSVTIGGSVAQGDVVTLEVTNGVLGSAAVSVSYTAKSGDTVATVAAALAKAFNATQSLVRYGFWADTDGEGAVLVYQRGPVGNFTTLGHSTTGSETFTVTNPSGGDNVVVPLANFEFSFNGSTKSYLYGQPYKVSYPILTAMVSQGQKIC